MTNEELIRMFRNDPTWMGRDIADRVEALVKERDEACAAWEIEAATVKRFAERHERHLVMGAEARARAEAAEAKLSKCEALLAKAVEALEFYAEADNYEDQHKPESCGCCYYLHDAEIKEDGGARARATLAKLTGDKDE